jgi:hypothetical protein
MWLIRNVLIFNNSVASSLDVCNFPNYVIYAEVEHTSQGEGTTLYRFGDTQAQTPTLFVKLWTPKKAKQGWMQTSFWPLEPMLRAFWSMVSF